MEIKLDKIIQVDDRLVLENPTIVLEMSVINHIQNTVTPTIRYEGPGYSYGKTIDPMDYKDGWTIEEMEAHILKYLAAKEVPDIKSDLKR